MLTWLVLNFKYWNRRICSVKSSQSISVCIEKKLDKYYNIYACVSKYLSQNIVFYGVSFHKNI